MIGGLVPLNKEVISTFVEKHPEPASVTEALREKCPSTEFFLVCIFPYSVRMQANTDQKKLRIWTLFTQWSRVAVATKGVQAHLVLSLMAEEIHLLQKNLGIMEEILNSLWLQWHKNFWFNNFI